MIENAEHRQTTRRGFRAWWAAVGGDWVSLGVIGLGLAACLFGSVPAVLVSRWLGPVMQEVLATFRDPVTQWMVFACCGVYSATFILLQHRASGARFWRWTNPDVWLTAALVLAAVRYAFGYAERTGGTEALVLLGGVTLGKGMAWVVQRAEVVRRKAECGEQRSEDGGQASALLRDAATAPDSKRETDQKIDDRKMESPVSHLPVIIPVLLGLLVLAVFWRNEAGMQFQYREQARWSGPWDNPNGFGMLLGTGLVLAIGLLASGFRFQVSGFGNESVVRRPWSVVCGRLKGALYLVAAGILGFGLVKSYSRGAWVGTAVGLGFLAWGCWDRGIRGMREREQAKSGVQSPESGVEASSRDSRIWRFGGLLRQSAGPLVVIAVSLFVISFWSFRHTEQVVARRAFSMGNVNDFSWRNRVAAWVGAMQMMAERPLTGHGWNQVERVYDQYYRAPSVQEGMAIQLNDYLTLGATLGIPALVCFLGYVGLSLVNGQWSVASSQRSVVSRSRTKSTDHQLLTTDFASLTCRAAAVVLLIGFWFDGGLLRLATATLFWVLVELGRREGGPRMTRRDATLPTGMREV